jgi:AAA ATPase domain
MADDESFQSIWKWLQMEAAARSSQFASEWNAAWADLAALLHAQAAAFERAAPSVPDSGGPTTLRHLMGATANEMLFEPVHAYRKARPYERALAALENYQAGIEDLVRGLPHAVAVRGPDLLETLDPVNTSRLRGYVLGRLHQPAQLAIRSIVERQFINDAKARIATDGAFLLTLAKGPLLLLAPWQAIRHAAIPWPPRPGSSESAMSEAWAHWQERSSGLEGEANEALRDISEWCNGLSGRLARALLHGGTRLSPRRRGHWLHYRQSCFRYWSRQQRAVKAVLDLEFEMGKVTVNLTTACERGLDSLDREQAALLEELDNVSHWLQEAQTGEAGQTFPPPQAELVSAEDRVSAWERAAEAAAMDHLVPTVETVEPRRALPSWRSPWRTLEPRKAFLSALVRCGRETVRSGFQEAEADHRAVVREIERVREVVTFSLESATKEDGQGAQIAREGIANALALVSYRKQAVTDPHALVQRKLAEAAAGVIAFTHLALDQGRLGMLTQLAQQSGTRLLDEAWRLVLARTSEAGRWMRDLVRSRYHQVLQKIGWEAPQVGTVAPVAAQTYLGEVLSLQPGARDLPMIYRRLFRLAPVEEPRFLIGREPEMAALAQARALWQARRSVSVLLVGARGSGKTSLLNCASAAQFSDATIVRSQFRERITTAAQMRAFLHELFGLRADEDLRADLLANPRVVMLEEMERTFLRKMNGFEGMRELLAIISATGRSTLWILSLNQHSFRYLDAANNLSRHFTHRINAMAVPPQDLKNAILLRHYLSGLRLEYPALPESDPRVSRIRQLIGLQQSAEELFFDSLYRQSEGVFRSAFELWRHYMERVEGGVLYMREPKEPHYDDMVGQLSLDGALTLQAILQHGSLTDRDHSEIFECPIEESRMELERLAGLECLEPEPASPGLRIRPEAGRFVHMALHRLNLI